MNPLAELLAYLQAPAPRSQAFERTRQQVTSDFSNADYSNMIPGGAAMGSLKKLPYAGNPSRGFLRTLEMVKNSGGGNEVAERLQNALQMIESMGSDAAPIQRVELNNLIRPVLHHGQTGRIPAGTSNRLVEYLMSLRDSLPWGYR